MASSNLYIEIYEEEKTKPSTKNIIIATILDQKVSGLKYTPHKGFFKDSCLYNRICTSILDLN